MGSHLSWKPDMYILLISIQYTLATECFQLGYNAEGHCKGEVDTSLPKPQKLSWEIPSEVSFYSLTYVTNMEVHHWEIITSLELWSTIANLLQFENVMLHVQHGRFPVHLLQTELHSHIAG